MVESSKKYLIANGKEMKFLSVNEIAYLEADGNYTNVITTSSKKYVSIRKIREFENSLPEDDFLRVHNSYIVNLTYVNKFFIDNECQIEMENGDHVPVSRRKKTTFLSRFHKI